MRDKDEIEKAIDRLAPWFHNIHLPNGMQTAPGHYLGDFPSYKWREVASYLPGNLKGMKALDIGCNAGFYAVELAKRGAEVTAIDLDPHYLEQGKWVVKQFGLDHKINFRKMQVYDLSKATEKYDVIWFMGVFYHLRYPLLALDILSEKCNKYMIFQTLTMPGEEELQIAADYKINDRKPMLQPGWPKMAFIENRLNGDPTNWWAPNHACIEAMLRTCGFKVMARPAHESYICVRDEKSENVIESWNRSEYLSATGKDYDEKVLLEKVRGK